MQKMAKYTFLFLVLVYTSSFAWIKVEGVVPINVTKGFLYFEYKRIYHLLSPKSTIDRSPLTVKYYVNKQKPNEAYSLPEWGGGGAIGDHTIIIPLDGKVPLYKDLSKITIHEIAHIVLNRISRGIKIPRWFHEGMAMTVSGDMSFQEQIVLSKAILTHSILPLASIDSVNTFSHLKAQLAYCQSRQAVQFLISTYGIEIVRNLLYETRKNRNFYAGLYASLGLTPAEFDSVFRKYLIKQFRFFYWIADTYIFWGALLLLSIAGFFVTRHRKKKRMAELEKEEELEDLLNEDETDVSFSIQKE